MRSFIVSSVALLALVPAFVAALPGNSGLQARSLTGSTHKHAAHAQAARSSKARRSKKIRKSCVARPPGNATVTDNAVTTGAGGTIKNAKACGNFPVGATSQITANSGPNGSLDWLNCGAERYGPGWNPPHIAVSDVVYVPLEHKGPFTECSADIMAVIWKYAEVYQIPAIFLASFAMQESTCNPKVIGGGGEVGLFQLTHEKCEGRSTEACQEVDFNTRTAAKFFADTIAACDGNLLLALGKYNGWFKNMTYDDATAALTSKCCLCQNNLDYLHQWLNGWVQGIDPRKSNPRLGTYFNLEQCK